LKVGYAHVTDAGWLARMTWLKGHQDFGTAHFNQAVLESILESGGLNRHLAALRPRYRKKMHCLDRALEAAGLRAAGWSWQVPAGGLCMWLRGPESLDTSGSGPLWNAAMQEKVLYVPGALCLCSDGPASFVRLSFGVLDEPDLEKAAGRFARAASRVAAPEPSPS
jgi:2-aminoadipate transaminase